MKQKTERAFSSAEALRFGWQATCTNLGPLIALGLAGAFLGLVFEALARPAEAPALVPVVRVILQLVQAALVMTFLRVALQIADGRPVAFLPSQPFLADFFTYLVTTIVYSLIVAGGLILLIVPGVMWAVRFGYAPFLAIDRKSDPIEALRESARVTRGARGQLFTFALLLVAINLLGALTFGIGLLVSIPTSLIAAAHVLRRLQARVASAPPTAAPPAHPGFTPRGLPT